jgi:hypothetical protein
VGLHGETLGPLHSKKRDRPSGHAMGDRPSSYLRCTRPSSTCSENHLRCLVVQSSCLGTCASAHFLGVCAVCCDVRRSSTTTWTT